MNLACTWFLYFYCYAFLGWLCEVVYCSIGNRKLVNRGFLHECICPIYGFGGVAVLALLLPVAKYPLAVFFLGVLVTSALEYATSFIMEKLFKMRWWDYSRYKFNIKGRVCLLNSTLFGLLVLALVYLIHPLVVSLVGLLSGGWLYIVSAFLFVGVITDTVFSVLRTVNLSTVLSKAKEGATKKAEELKALQTKLNAELKKMVEEKIDSGAEYVALQKKCLTLAAARLKQERIFKRFVKNGKYFESKFPNLSHSVKSVSESLSEIRSKIEDYIKSSKDKE